MNIPKINQMLKKIKTAVDLLDTLIEETYYSGMKIESKHTICLIESIQNETEELTNLINEEK